MRIARSKRKAMGQRGHALVASKPDTRWSRRRCRACKHRHSRVCMPMPMLVLPLATSGVASKGAHASTPLHMPPPLFTCLRPSFVS